MSRVASSPGSPAASWVDPTTTVSWSAPGSVGCSCRCRNRRRAQTGSSRWSTPLQRTYFGLSTNYTVDGTLLAEYALKEMNAKKIATIFQDDAFGREGADGFKATFEKLGIKPIVEIGTQPGDSDYSSAVLKLQQVNPDVVCQYIISSAAANDVSGV